MKENILPDWVHIEPTYIISHTREKHLSVSDYNLLQGGITEKDLLGNDRFPLHRLRRILDQVPEGNVKYKLNENQVLEIRKKHSKGGMIKVLAKEYKVTYQAVYWIIKRKTWKHI